MTTFSRPIVCPVLVGRSDALSALRSQRDQAHAQGGVVLVSGEAGIGKSRLVDSFLRESAGAGLRLLRTGFYEQDTGVPYSAFARLLGDLIDRSPAPYGAPGPGLDELAPELLQLVSSSASTHTAPDADKRQIVMALVTLVRRLCRAGASILALEDLHWADAASIDAVLEIAKSRTPGCLLVLTYRSNEISSDLNSMLADLDRERLASEVRLSGLRVSDVDNMIRACLQSPRSTRADVLHIISQLAEGNPFFVEELVRSIVDQAGSIEAVDTLKLSGVNLPRGIDETVRRRSRALSAGARLVLQLAAVAGVRFDFLLLAELSGLAEDDLLEAVKELIDAQLVKEEADEGFAFRHALTREAVRSSMLRRERRLLSQKVGEALERLHADEIDMHLEDLAYHYYEAGHWSNALLYSQRAGERAMRLYAPGAAVVHLTRAIDAGHHLASVDLGEAFRLRGTANEAIGDFESARDDYEAAASDTGRDAGVRWQALLDLGLLWAARDYAKSEPYLREALEIARDLGDPAKVARSLGRLGNWRLNMGDVESALNMSEEALAIFREIGDETGIAQTLDLLGITCTLGMRFDRAVLYYREAIARLEALDDRRTLASALASIQLGSSSSQTDMMPPSLSLEEGSAFGERALAITRDMGWKPDQSYALWQLAMTTAPQGQPMKGLAYAREAVAIAQEIGHTQWETGGECAMGSILTDLLATGEAEKHLQRALELAREMNSRLWVGQAQAMTIDTLLAARQPVAALELYESVATDELSDFGPRELYTSGTDAVLASGDTDRALAMLHRLEAEAERHSPGKIAIRLGRMHARALVLSGHLTAGIEMTKTVLEIARSQGHVSYEWRLCADLAHARLALGDRDAARRAANAAIDRIDLVASRIDDEFLRHDFEEKSLLLLPATLRRHPGGPTVELLTPREQEIAALVAQGLTSHDIADRLVLSSRTVESHVANAMAKLGFTTRAQLAAWAVEHARDTSGH